MMNSASPWSRTSTCADLIRAGNTAPRNRDRNASTRGSRRGADRRSRQSCSLRNLAVAKRVDAGPERPEDLDAPFERAVAVNPARISARLRHIQPPPRFPLSGIKGMFRGAQAAINTAKKNARPRWGSTRKRHGRNRLDIRNASRRSIRLQPGSSPCPISSSNFPSRGWK